MKQKLPKEIRLNIEGLQVRNEEPSDVENDKMIIEGYPIVFDQETYIDVGDPKYSWYEKVDRSAFSNTDMNDVVFKYNHDDEFFILARTRNQSLKLTIDEHGVFIHAELIDTTTNRDVYKMVKSGLLKEGSFAFTIEDYKEEDKEDGIHRTITKIGKLFDVAICPHGAYGDLTEIYARSYAKVETLDKEKVETLKRCDIIRLRNSNKLKLIKEERND